MGSINVEKLYDEKIKDVNWTLFEYVIKMGIRFLDDIIDINEYVLPEFKENVLGNRKIGLGIAGWANLLIKMGIRYDSNKCLNFIDKVFSFKQKIEKEYNTELGLEKGNFLNWNESIYAKTNTSARCSAISTQAPTGSISSILNTTAYGIEPHFGVAYKRRIITGEIYEANELFAKMLHDIINDETKEQKIIKECYEKGTAQINSVPKQLKELFRCANDISSDWHIKIQAQFQKYYDNAISKCIAKGTLINTNLGSFKIEELGYARGVDIFDNPISEDIKVIDHEGNWQKITKHYSGGIKSTKIVKMNNGNIIEGTLVHKILTSEGWKTLNEVKKGDYILNRVANYGNREGKLPIDISNIEIRKECKSIILPNYMSPDLALLLGMIVSDGHLTQSTGNIGVTCANDKVEKLTIELFTKLFNLDINIMPDKRTKSTRNIYVTSKPLCNLLKSLIGNNCVDKHIPKQILQGSVEEQLSFIKGITLDGFNKKQGERNELVIYEGYSKQLVDELMSICNSLGLSPYRGSKKVISGRLSNIAYSISIDSNIIQAIENHKNTWKTPMKRMVLTPEEVYQLDIKYDHPEYRNFNYIKKNKPKVVFSNVLDKLGIEYDKTIYFTKITDITNSESEVYDIEVENTHSYLINGIVSHNTINAPENATKDELFDLLIKAWELDIKGVTYYRNNSRKNQTMQIGKSKESNDSTLKRGQIIKAPTEADGKTYKFVSGCGNVYLNVTYDKNGNINQTFTNKGSSGTCRSNQEAVSRLISLSLRGGISIDEVIDQLKSVDTCPAYVSARKGGKKVSKGSSCPNAIGYILEQAKEELKNKNIKVKVQDIQLKQQEEVELPKESKNHCPECGEEIVLIEGCVSCKACGWSRCS